MTTLNKSKRRLALTGQESLSVCVHRHFDARISDWRLRKIANELLHDYLDEFDQSRPMRVMLLYSSRAFFEYHKSVVENSTGYDPSTGLRLHLSSESVQSLKWVLRILRATKMGRIPIGEIPSDQEVDTLWELFGDHIPLLKVKA